MLTSITNLPYIQAGLVWTEAPSFLFGQDPKGRGDILIKLHHALMELMRPFSEYLIAEELGVPEMDLTALVGWLHKLVDKKILVPCLVRLCISVCSHVPSPRRCSCSCR